LREPLLLLRDAPPAPERLLLEALLPPLLLREEELEPPLRDPPDDLLPPFLELPPEEARFVDDEAFFELLLPPLREPPPEALPPLRPAIERFAEVTAFLEPPFFEPPFAPPARFAEAELLDDFDDLDDDFEDFEDFDADFLDDFELDLLLDPPPFFAPFDALFFAAMVVSPI